MSDPQLSTVDRAEPLRKLKQLLGDPARDIDEDQVREHGVGPAQPARHDLTQEELAQLVGASRETVNKALADFVHRGWIQLQGKSVVVLDEDRLRRRAR